MLHVLREDLLLYTWPEKAKEKKQKKKERKNCGLRGRRKTSLPSYKYVPAEDLVHEPVDQAVKRGIVQQRLARTDPSVQTQKHKKKKTRTRQGRPPSVGHDIYSTVVQYLGMLGVGIISPHVAAFTA